MNVRFYFQEIDKASKEQLEKHFADKKLNRLTHLLQHGNLELAKFVLNAKYHKHHDIFIVRLGLKVAKKDFEAEEKNYNLIEAFDLAFNRLIDQLRKLETTRRGR